MRDLAMVTSTRENIFKEKCKDKDAMNGKRESFMKDSG